MRARTEDQEGTILLPVILLLLLLASAATAMTLQAQTSLREAATRRVRLSLSLTADAAVRAAALALATATAGRTAPPFAIDGTPEGCSLRNGRRLVLSVQDEGGRVDLNKALPDLVLQVLLRSGVSGRDAKAMADAIVARRGSDGASVAGAKMRVRPAKTVATRSNGFTAVDEIDSLPDMQPALFGRLRPLFTVTNGSAGVDPVVAAPAVRAAIPAKELASPALEPLTTPSNHSDFTVTATVAAGSGIRFARQAGFHLDPQTGPLGRFVSWDAPAFIAPIEAGDGGPFCRRVAAALSPE